MPKYYIHETWGCIVGHGIPGSSSAFLKERVAKVGERTVRDRERRVFTEEEVKQYLRENRERRNREGVMLMVVVEFDDV